MQTKQVFFFRQNARFVAAAILLAVMPLCATSPSFGQTLTTAPDATSVGGYGYKPQPVTPPTAAEELRMIIEWIYFPDFLEGAYCGRGCALDCCEPPQLLGVFNERLVLSRNSKTAREIGELIAMISQRGKLPERLQKIEAKNAALEEKLLQPISLAVEDMPLGDFLKLLQEEHDIVSWVDLRAFDMEDMGNPLEETVTLNVTDLPVVCVLELALRQEHDPTGYRFNNGVLEIMPMPVLEHWNDPRVYDVTDLLLQSCEKTEKIEELIRVFETMFELPPDADSIDKDEYADTESFLMPYQKELIVAYLPQHRHRQLEAALYAMRNDGRCMSRQQTRIGFDRIVYDKLQQEISVDFEEIPFEEAIASLREQTGLTFFISENDFENEDMCSPCDEYVTLNMQNQPVETILDFMMRQLEDTADYIAWNGVVYIAPKVTCEQMAEPYFFVHPVATSTGVKPETPEPTPTPVATETPASKPENNEADGLFDDDADFADFGSEF